MSLNLSLAQLLANLERRIALHRDQAVHHARQEEHHREQRALHEAELEKVSQHFEAFKSLTAAVVDLAGPAGLPFAEGDADLGPRPGISKMVARVIEGKPDGETFNATGVTQEIRSRFQDRLPKRLDPRTVSATLRRLCLRRRIQIIREGKGPHGAVYTKGVRVGDRP